MNCCADARVRNEPNTPLRGIWLRYLDAPCQIHGGRIKYACNNINNIGGYYNINERFHVINTEKCGECIQKCIKKLGYQRGAIVAQPQKTSGILVFFFCLFPDRMICPHIKRLHNHIHYNAAEHNPRRT